MAGYTTWIRSSKGITLRLYCNVNATWEQHKQSPAVSCSDIFYTCSS